ncbi:TonB-dependent receptor plug domain-containing protein [Rehaibacterium terrae]|jgi:iron complex outermembrane receptor protein|uniref:Iron complex outermembrane receptor protein n=1 Tax=Rehaibacterium terrae TaxID=1341696 RepID=A0A7W7V6P8_9GAMM|nr:TonB-dependent receptor [Rehaibacterium terrae]MBB5014262.1 iron complex outermembrane receptor protein [Rehaibacterium terrae]
MDTLKRAIAVALGVVAGGFTAAGIAVAQETQETEETQEAARLDQVFVVGSRRANVSAADTPVPIDVIDFDKPATRGLQVDLAQTLQYLTPSFNSTRQTGADGADLIDSAALRGLGSDQTLVLVNGKRRHTVALVNLFGARNRGNTGTDLNTIPLLAIDRVEILRDGAAAQYGSDAIAGVMNIALKRRAGCESTAGYGQYTRGDGANWLLSGYCGFETARGGIVALTGEYLDRGRSDRSGPDNPRIIGDSKVENATLLLNGEQPLTDNASVYFTAGIQQRDASSGAFARDGDEDIPSRNSAAMYPNGFVPFINADVDDRSGTLGVRGYLGEWMADLSATTGYNRMLFRITNTLNASIANADLLAGGRGISPDAFDAGGFSFRQNTVNLDFTRYFDGVMQGMNVAFGAEYRHENYEIYAGEPGSYIDADGPGGGNAGSQGFPGFQPGDETDSTRSNRAAYIDVETQFTDRLTVATAARFEDYSDFGTTLDGKLALAFRATDALLLRGSASTGFRAPSLQQRFFSSTFTDFISGVPVDVLLAPNGGTVANAAGIPALTEETSRSFTAGFTWAPTDDLTVTVDAYRITIDDRIVLSGRFDTDDPNIGGILEGLGVGEAQFFVNSVDTRTRGLDLTVAHRTAVGDGVLSTFFAANFNRNEVTRIHAPPSLVGREDVLLSERERLFIEEGAPRRKATLGFDYSLGAWDSSLKIIHFGPQTLGTFSGPPVPNARYAAKTSADVAVTYNFSENTRLTVGGANVFDVFPTRQDPDETDNGHVFDSVQFGLNGASWFVRLWHRF